MIRQEADFLLVSVLFGAGLTAVYDILRIARRAVRHASAAVAVEDFLYWIFAALACFCLLFAMNDGNMRWFALAGALSGMWLYHISLSRVVVALFGTALGYLLKWIGFPLKVAASLLKKQKKWLTMKIRLILEERKKKKSGKGLR